MAAANAELPLDVEAANKRALELLEDWFVVRCREEIEATKWKWETTPKLRDIVASGRLRDSARITRSDDGSFSVTWTVDYATNVHEGGVDPESGEKYEGRPWTKEPLRQLPVMYAHFMKIALKEQAVALKQQTKGFSTV